MDNSLPPFKIFSGTNSRYIAEEIAKELGVELGKMNIQRFADGEFEVSFEESIRGCEVYIVQSTFPNCDNLMELLLMIDAAKRASAKSTIAVMPYFGWARQDRKDKPRFHRCKTGVRSSRDSRCGSRNHNGPACRPDSGLLQCPC